MFHSPSVVWSVTGVAGRASDLPCYLNPRTHGDRPKLILWYKRGIRTPVFRWGLVPLPLLSLFFSLSSSISLHRSLFLQYSLFSSFIAFYHSFPSSIYLSFFPSKWSIFEVYDLFTITSTFCSRSSPLLSSYYFVITLPAITYLIPSYYTSMIFFYQTF